MQRSLWMGAPPSLCRCEKEESMGSEKKDRSRLKDGLWAALRWKPPACAAENGVFWMVIFLGTLSVLSLFSAGRQAIQTGGGKVRNLAQGRSHRTEEGLRPICSVDNGLPQVALTFELTKGTEGVEEVLGVLDEEQVRATFFISGHWALEQPALAKEIGRRGHDIGSLGLSGRSMETIGREERREEILQARQAIQEATGKEPVLFRPPADRYDDELLTLICGLGCQPVLWDVDSFDWKDYGQEQLKKQVLGAEGLQAGSILRFHCGARYTPGALGEIVRGLKERGAVITPLSQMIIREDYHLDVDGRQRAD